MQAPASIDREEQIDLIALWRMAWRYKYLIALAGAVGGLIAVVVALTATPIYRAEAVVTEVHDTGMNGAASLLGQFGGIANLAGINLPSGGADGNARAILESRSLIEEFVKREALVAQLFPDAKKPPTLWSAVNRFQGEILSIREDKRKGRTTITIDWSDPRTAARWANGFVALANDIVRTRAMEESNRSIAYLNGQLAKTDAVEVRRVIYNLIETETKTLMLANVRAEYAFSVVDAAVTPETRIKPRRTMIVLLGGLLGLVAGVIAAFIHNALRQGRRADLRTAR